MSLHIINYNPLQWLEKCVRALLLSHSVLYRICFTLITLSKLYVGILVTIEQARIDGFARIDTTDPKARAALCYVLAFTGQ